MTISSTSRIAGPFAGDGMSNSFPFSFKVFSATDVKAVLADPLGAETVLTYGVHYTCTINADQDVTPGGTVNTTTAVAIGYTLTITSAVPALQTADLINAGGWYPSVIEDALDRQTIVLQQLKVVTDRALTVPISSPSGASLPTPTASTLIGWNATATGLQNYTPTNPAAWPALYGALTGASFIGFDDSQSYPAQTVGHELKTLNKPQSALHYQSSGANVHRLADRLFVGGAVSNDANYPNIVEDWLTAFQRSIGHANGSIVSSVFSSITQQSHPNSSVGASFAARSDYHTATTSAAIGSISIAVNNNATLSTDAWGQYTEAHHTGPLVNATYGHEINTRTVTDSISSLPHVLGNVVALQLASGAGVSGVGQYDASAAIEIRANPKSFKKGVVFGSNSIAGTDGTTGYGYAIELVKGHIIRWTNSTNQTTGALYSDAASTANAINIGITDTGLLFTATVGGQILFSVGVIPSAVNWLSPIAAQTGSPVQLFAQGSDTNIDISLTPKGTGKVRITNGLQNYANDAAAAAGGVPVNGLYRNGSVVQIRVT